MNPGLHRTVPQSFLPDAIDLTAELGFDAVESLGDQGDGTAKVERGYVVIVSDARATNHGQDRPYAG